MKFQVLIMLVFVTTFSTAQTILKSSFKQLGHSIEDDGKTLRMYVNGQRLNGEKVRFKRDFDISGLSVWQTDSLKGHILDSLGIAYTFVKPDIKPLISAPIYQNVRFECGTCGKKGHLEIYGKELVSTRRLDGKNESRAFPITIALSPGDYRLVYFRRKRSESVQISFTTKYGENSVVTIN